jgi:hypothetical protein
MTSKQPTQRDFLLACAAWQDSLLQSYRTFHVTIQGFLLAAGAAVLAVQLTGAIQEQASVLLAAAVFNALFTALLGFLFWLQRKTSNELRHVVDARCQDVDFWHRKIIQSESGLDSSQRTFTEFKVWQQARRASVDHLVPRFPAAQGISVDDTNELIGKGLGHTREALDINLFGRLQWLWNALLASSVGTTSWFVWTAWRLPSL